MFRNKKRTFYILIGGFDHIRLVSTQDGGDVAKVRYRLGYCISRVTVFLGLLYFLGYCCFCRVIIFHELLYFQAYDRLIKGMAALTANAAFSRDDRLGWLTSCPTNLGTTINMGFELRIPRTLKIPTFETNCDEDKVLFES